MGSDTPSATPPALPFGRLAGVGLVVFLANSAMLVLELVAGRLLAPFIGSSLETWTSVLGVFLAGIALGNGFGGKLADRYPTPRTLAILLAAGALAAVWMVVFPILLAGTATRYRLSDEGVSSLKREQVPEAVLSKLDSLKNRELPKVDFVNGVASVLSQEEREQYQARVVTHARVTKGVYESIPLDYRIPLLSVILCLPAALILSLLTPLAIKLGLPDVSRTGRVAGTVFALSTLGSLLGNYLTGFFFIPSFTINTLVLVSAGALGVLSLGSFLLQRSSGVGVPPGAREGLNSAPAALPPPDAAPTTNPHAFSDIRLAFLIVFLGSFVGMSLELTAVRILSQHLGVSLFTWTGAIGVMLAGTALGNFTGGWLADRVNRPGPGANPRYFLSGTLLAGGGGVVSYFVSVIVMRNLSALEGADLYLQVVGWTFGLFFVPMFALGMVSPQVIRLAVPDVSHAGQVSGRVYAWSTAGAIAGTFGTGYFLLSALGMERTLLVLSLVMVLSSLLVVSIWNYNPLLYLFSIVLGVITGGLILNIRSGRGEDLVGQLETNYYTIQVIKERDRDTFLHTGRRVLQLDHLIHSTVDTGNPFFLYYTHEHVQMEFLRAAREADPNPRALVIGGGGYTFPRYAMELMPEARLDVVEIDPGVTWMAKEHLALKEYPGLNIQHMDGRQYVAERVAPGTYDLIVQDAVNDLSVPAHLLTKEYNDLVKAALKPNGVYLLTVIDSVGKGQLWKAAVHTLQKTFPPENVALLMTNEDFRPNSRIVYVIYASDRPLDLDALRDAVLKQLAGARQGFTAATQVGSSAGGLYGLSGLTSTVPVMGLSPKVYNDVLFRTHEISRAKLNPYLDAPPAIVLTDQYAPVDNLMAEIFRHRYDQ